MIQEYRLQEAINKIIKYCIQVFFNYNSIYWVQWETNNKVQVALLGSICSWFKSSRLIHYDIKIFK